MTCGFCGKTFDEQAGAKACKGCALFGGCRKARCAHCGYEMPAETRLMRWIRQWKDRRS